MRSRLPWEVSAKSFVGAVRAGTIASPAQRAFSEEDWKRAFEKFEAPSLADTRLYHAGLYFNLRFGEVRDALAQAPGSRTGISERVSRLVGYANYLLLAAEKKIEPNQDSDDSAQRQERIDAFHNFARWGDDHVTSMIDGLRYPLAEQWRIETTAAGPRLTEEQQLSAVSRSALLGRLYDALEDTWNHCMWRGWYFTTIEDHPAIVASDLEFESRKAVGDFRYTQLSIETGLISHEAWERAGALERAALLSQPRVVRIEKSGKKKKRLFVGTGLTKGEPTQADFIQILALDTYTEPLVERQSAALKGMAVEHLLAAWYILSPLAELLFRDASLPEEILSPTALRHLSPLIPVAELNRVLVETLGIREDQSATLVDLLTFRDDHRIDLWSRPFIEVNGSDVAVLRAVLSATNLNRLVTRWIRDAGFSLDERGPLWEEEIRSAVSNGNKLANAQIHPKSFEFRTGSGVEEIDFLARIGNTVLVGEAKCSLIPTNAHDYARFVELLADAADQAARKADCIEREASSFLKQISWGAQEPLRVLPFVITNQAQGVGYQFGAVPVVDRLILERYFNEAELQQGVLRAGTKILSTAKTIRFYATPDEAEQNVESYLSDPPQLAIPRANVITEGVPLPPFSHEFLGCHVVVRRVSFPPVWVGGDKPDWMKGADDSDISQPSSSP
jgi:hypothetical protein